MNSLAEYVNIWGADHSPLESLLLTLVLMHTALAVALAVHTACLMRIRHRRKEKRDALRTRVEEEMALWLAGINNDDVVSERLRKALKGSRWTKDITLDVILAVSKLFRPDNQTPLRHLVYRLGLDAYCLRQMQESDWRRQTYLVRLFGQLQLTETLPLLKQKLNSEYPALRFEAITAMVAFGDQTWMGEVSNMSKPLTDWEQMMLLEHFKRLPTSQLPPFERWLGLARPDWVLFAVRLCRHFNRFDKIPTMGKLLRSQPSFIQDAILDAFYYLGSPAVLPYVLDFLPRATGERLFWCFKILGHLGDRDVAPVLTVYADDPDAGIRVAALNSLKQAGLRRDEVQRLVKDVRFVNHVFSYAAA